MKKADEIEKSLISAMEKFEIVDCHEHLDSEQISSFLTAMWNWYRIFQEKTIIHFGCRHAASKCCHVHYLVTL